MTSCLKFAHGPSQAATIISPAAAAAGIAEADRHAEEEEAHVAVALADSRGLRHGGPVGAEGALPAYI